MYIGTSIYFILYVWGIVSKNLAIGMSALKQLGLLVRICQLSGLIPFTMDISQTGQFLRFNFSWKHYTTWYYLAVLVLQVTGMVTMSLGGRQFVASDGTSFKLPIGLLILTGISVSCYVFLFLLTKITVLLGHARFRKAFAFIREVEQHLGDIIPPGKDNSVVKRTFLCFLFIGSLVSEIKYIFTILKALTLI